MIIGNKLALDYFKTEKHLQDQFKFIQLQFDTDNPTQDDTESIDRQDLVDKNNSEQELLFKFSISENRSISKTNLFIDKSSFIFVRRDSYLLLKGVTNPFPR